MKKTPLVITVLCASSHIKTLSAQDKTLYPSEIVISQSEWCGPQPTELCSLEFENYQLARKVRSLLWERDWLLVSAESLTAGNFSGTLGKVHDASKGLAGGLVSYDVSLKNSLLQVSGQTGSEVVNAQSALEMVMGLSELTAPALMIQQQQGKARQIQVSISFTGFATTWTDELGNTHHPVVHMGLKIGTQTVMLKTKTLRRDLRHSPLERVMNVQLAISEGLRFLKSELEGQAPSKAPVAPNLMAKVDPLKL